MATATKSSRKAKATKKTATTARRTATTRAARADRTIKVKAKENPRRKGTAAYRFFDAMSKSGTVGKYLSRFKTAKERRDASLWLSTSARQGHVQVSA